MKYVTADLHFGHDNIIKYCKRPFKNSNEMDRILVDNINNTVSSSDDLYVLGDFSLKYAEHFYFYRKIFDRINCNVHIVAGNHDELSCIQYIKAGAKSFHFPYFEIDEFIGCHDPALSQADTTRWFLVGHIHNLFKIKRNCINVGVDVNKFKPISLDQIREMIKDIKLE